MVQSAPRKIEGFCGGERWIDFPLNHWRCCLVKECLFRFSMLLVVQLFPRITNIAFHQKDLLKRAFRFSNKFSRLVLLAFSNSFSLREQPAIRKEETRGGNTRANVLKTRTCATNQTRCSSVEKAQFVRIIARSDLIPSLRMEPPWHNIEVERRLPRRTPEAHARTRDIHFHVFQEPRAVSSPGRPLLPS